MHTICTNWWPGGMYSVIYNAAVARKILFKIGYPSTELGMRYRVQSGPLKDRCGIRAGTFRRML